MIKRSIPVDPVFYLISDVDTPVCLCCGEFLNSGYTYVAPCPNGCDSQEDNYDNDD